MALMSCVTCDLCVGVMYGVVTLIGRQKGMLSCDAIRCISRFRIAALAKSRFMRAMCACHNVVCNCLVCCAPDFVCPADGSAGTPPPPPVRQEVKLGPLQGSRAFGPQRQGRGGVVLGGVAGGPMSGSAWDAGRALPSQADSTTTPARRS